MPCQRWFYSAAEIPHTLYIPVQASGAAWLRIDDVEGSSTPDKVSHCSDMSAHMADHGRPGVSDVLYSLLGCANPLLLPVRIRH